MTLPSYRPNFVYFDLGNVLCFFDHGRSARQMAELLGVDQATVRRLVYESDLEHRYEKGLITGEEFVDELVTALGRRVVTGDLLRAASDMFEPNLQILPVLQLIRDKGIPMGLLSNTNAAHWEWICAQRYPVLQEWFEPRILSFEVYLMKPESEIYRLSTERAREEPAGIFFIDDRHDNIEGAKSFGWQASLFTHAESLQKIVESW